MARKKYQKRKNDAEKKLLGESVDKLVEMGFSKQQAKQALNSSYNDFDSALQLLAFAEPEGKKNNSKRQKRQKRSHENIDNNGVIDVTMDDGQDVQQSSSSSSRNGNGNANNGVHIDLSKEEAVDISPSKSKQNAFRELELEEKKKFDEKKASGLKKRELVEDKIMQSRNVLKHLESGTKRLKKIIADIPQMDKDNMDPMEDLRKQVLWYQRALYEELEKQIQVNNSFKDEIMVQTQYENQMEQDLKQMEIEFADAKLARQFQQEQQDSGRRMSLEDRNILMLKNNYQYKKVYSCSICLDDELNVNSILVLSCGHYWCKDCLKRTFEGKITDGFIGDTLTCPNPECDTKIDYEEIQLSVSNEVFEKYERFLLESHLKKDPDCRWCPRAGCETAMLGMPGAKMMRCPKCETRFCFTCKTEEYHDGVTCEAFQQWQKENGSADAEFSKWAQTYSKICPKCKVRIEKNGGCDHMTCRNCKYEFYWSSGKPYGKFAPQAARGRGGIRRGRGR